MRKFEKKQIVFTMALLAILLFQSVAVLSQQNINLKLYKPGTSIALLSVNSVNDNDKERLNISIQDEQGITLYSEESKSAAYAKMFDFNKMGNGRYYITIKNPNRVVRKVVEKEESSISIREEQYFLSSNISKVRKEDKKVVVNFQNNLGAEAKFILRDKEGHILHEEDGIKPGNYTTLLNMSHLTGGEYNMTFMSGSLSNSRSFQID